MRWMPQVPRTLLISAAMVWSGWPAYGQGQVLLGLERADSLGGRWSEVFMGPEMMTNGKIAGGAVTNGAGFWRMRVEVAPTNAPTGPNITVPRQASTIQAAVDALTNGGTVYISPGVYSNPVTITGKVVNLVGITNEGKAIISGPILNNRTDFAAAQGLINYGPNAGGTIMNVVVMGGDTGIRGFTSAEPRALPPSVTLSNVSIGRSVRGVAGTFSELNVVASTILQAAAHGISVSNANNAALKFAGSFLGDCTELGLRVISARPANQPLSILITNSVFSGNQQGGAAMIGPISVLAFNSKFVANSNVAFWCSDLATSNNLLYNCSFSHTSKWFESATGRGGYGVAIANNSSVAITLSELVGNEVGGLGVENAGASLAASTVTGNGTYGVYIYGGPFSQLGANIITNNGTGPEDNLIIYGEFPVPGPPKIPQD